MNIFIAGGGRVGFHLARLLCAEKHAVTVIETDPNRAEYVDYSLDVRTKVGPAQDVLLLKSLDAGSADLFIATTGDDELNLIAATTAKGLGAKKVVAQVRGTLYMQSDILYETIMGIDFLVSPQALTAHEIVQYIEHPGVLAAETFGRSLISMQQIRVSSVPLQPGETLKDLKLPPDVLIGLVGRNGTVEIASGSTKLEPGDFVTLVGRKESIEATSKLFSGEEVQYNKIVIMGGSRTGVHLAEVLEKQGKRVKIFDIDMDRCNEIAGMLKKTKVVCRDATSRLSLEQEHVDGADLFVATTHDDERNIMACVMAKEVGAREALAVVHQPDFAFLVQKLGIDHAVTPRVAVANRIMRAVTGERRGASAVMEDGQIEVFEFELSTANPLNGTQLMKMRLPSQTLLASIVRGESIIVPRGSDHLQPGDTVVVLTANRNREAVIKLFEQ